MKKNKQPHLTFIAAILVFASTAKASAVYFESAMGDSNGGQFISLAGSTIFFGSQTLNDAVDGFRFSVPEGQQFKISIMGSFSGIPDGEAMAMVWDLWQLPSGTGSCTPTTWEYSCTGGGFGSTYITGTVLESQQGFAVPASPLGPELNSIVLNPGTYEINDNYKFTTSNSSRLGTLFYQIDIERIAIPIPPANWLFGSGLIGLAGAARKRKLA